MNDNYQEIWLSHSSIEEWRDVSAWSSYLSEVEVILGAKLTHLDDRDPVRKKVSSLDKVAKFICSFEDRSDKWRTNNNPFKVNMRSQLNTIISNLDVSSTLYRECAPIITELAHEGEVSLHPAEEPITADMATIYAGRYKHVTSRGLKHGGVKLAADFFASNVGRKCRVFSVTTSQFAGYAFVDTELKNLLAFPYTEKKSVQVSGNKPA